MQSFLTHMNEKAGSNGTIGLYKKDGQGGYTASDDETNHDCEEEHPGVSHKKWVAASKEVEEAMSPAEIIRRRKEQKRELVRGKRKSGKTSDKMYDYGIRKSEGKPVNVPKKNNNQRIEEIDPYTGQPIDELSKGQLDRYSREAGREIRKISPRNIHPNDRKNIPFNAEKKRLIAKRKLGIALAKSKIAKKTDEAYVSTRSRRRAFAQSQGSSHDMDDEGYQKDGSNPVDDRIRAKRLNKISDWPRQEKNNERG